jgi:hypothetical protein
MFPSEWLGPIAADPAAGHMSSTLLDDASRKCFGRVRSRRRHENRLIALIFIVFIDECDIIARSETQYSNCVAIAK